MNKAKLPTHVAIDARRYQIVKNSVILLAEEDFDDIVNKMNTAFTNKLPNKSGFEK